ncbi:unnamed protein product [Eruca vesicaria subsp. sativa]|uniref:Uncharacterized protein n=1 Tax=Eruca vesicaria subsp. sativa TaxID=29727 RepID=A0ABC8LK39_ERUVS|nr:unnamed protein product [Eruca vesicaria subsp. sativa]
MPKRQIWMHRNYVGPYNVLYSHYVSFTHHLAPVELIPGWFLSGKSFGIKMNISDKILILRQATKPLLFAVQCFRETFGVYVTVSCIAPSIRGVGHYSYHLTYIPIMRDEEDSGSELSNPSRC